MGVVLVNIAYAAGGQQFAWPVRSILPTIQTVVVTGSDVTLSD